MTASFSPSSIDDMCVNPDVTADYDEDDVVYYDSDSNSDEDVSLSLLFK